MKELKTLRERKVKHYLNEDGTITAQIYNNDIHYLNNGVYREIDNTLVDKGEYFENKYNSFKTKFNKNNNELVTLTNDNHFIKTYIKNNNNLNLIKDKENITYKDVFKNIDINYKVISSKLKENIILHNKNDIKEKLEFIIETDLNLSLKENKTIEATNNNEIIFTIEAPFMIDKQNKINKNIFYTLEKEPNNTYLLTLNLDTNWLMEEQIIYPVTIDPTITKNGENVYDTFISNAEPNNNFDRNYKLIIGCSKENVIYRALLKFILPTIGTSFDIVNAQVNLYSFPNRPLYGIDRKIAVHEITTEWDETTATWNNMSENYNKKYETYFYPSRTQVLANTTTFDITSIVKKWYAGSKNNGIMLKWVTETIDENFNEYECYSKYHDYLEVEETPRRPYLTITYRDQNGLLDYIDYANVALSNGDCYVNNKTGNLTSLFYVNQTISGKFPVTLNVIYNTQNVIMNTESGICKGWKFSLEETIEKEQLDTLEYLRLTSDTGASYYFYKKEENKYHDEDGMNMDIVYENNEYTLTDKIGNKKVYTNINDKYRLTKIVNTENSEINIAYENGLISKITDGNNEEINITYSTNNITITSNYETSTITIDNNKLTSIKVLDGITKSTYNENNIITKITDIDNLSFDFEYYDASPYKIKKVTEKSINNNDGMSLSFTYNDTNTTIINNLGIKSVYTFNANGNSTGKTIYTKNTNKIKEAYYESTDYYNEYVTSENTNLKNKPTKNAPFIKYTNNLLINSDFERPLEECNFDIFGTYGRQSKYPNDENYCLHIARKAYITYNITESNYYTLSLNIRPDLPYDGYVDIRLIEVLDDVETEVDKYYIRTVPNLGQITEFDKYTFTGYFHANSKLKIVFDAVPASFFFIDEMQLETGQVANERNLVENSDFTNRTTGWTFNNSNYCTYEVVNINEEEKALKINSHPEEQFTASYNFHLFGKKGETFRVSFWYKNEGITPYKDVHESQGNSVLMNLYHVNGELGTCAPLTGLKQSSEEWTYFNATFVANADFESANLTILSLNECNSLYITDIMVIKDPRTYIFEYDKNGNVIKTTGLNNNSSEFNYDDKNQLISEFNPKGNSFKYEYDNKVPNRILSGITDTGITNQIKYDSFGNPTNTIIKNTLKDNEIIENHNYNIRSKGTNEYLYFDPKENIFKFAPGDCNKAAFKLEKEEIDNETYYKLKIGSKAIKENNNNITLTKNSDYSLYILNPNENGSYSFITKSDVFKNLSNQNGILTITDKDVKLYNNQFYIEDPELKEYIESKSFYTEDGKFITSVVDTLGKETKYDINTKNGLTNSITNAKGDTTYLEYNDREELIKVTNNNKSIEYTYDLDSLTNIKSGTKNYKIEYDEFLNTKEIKINNNTLISYEYEENNGNGFKESYTYDSLNRISTLTKNDNIYNFLYDNFGNVAKIINDKETHIYNYDVARRLQKYISNNFDIKYTYDINNNIQNKKYSKDNIEFQNITYEYDKDDNLVKVIIDENEINYTYDNLGRLTNTNINNNLKIDYEYMSNGNKTSLVINKITIDNDTYKYHYDDLYNVTRIYINEEIANEYEYDTINELITAKDYQNNLLYKYVYDKEGNITEKKTYNLNNLLLKTDTFEYNDSNWEDLLTKYNDKEITYDTIGNPLTIGNDTLTWEKGKKLSSYNDYKYTYDLSGIRTSKEVDGIITNYKLENNLIILEEKPNIMLNYIYNSNEDLIGFKYNSRETYYYKKNSQNDIIGIYNSNYELIATYTYDPYGNILSIKDNLNNEITDKNNIAIINPFRYRSYYYDEETKLYYLNSRYYNPEWGRFINADKFFGHEEVVTTYNIFTYCTNNPINHKDITGEFIMEAIATEQAIENAIKVVATIACALVALSHLNNDSIAYSIDIPDFNNNSSKKKKKKKDKKEETNNLVYVLTDCTEDQWEKNSKLCGKYYVGRTNNKIATKNRHRNNPYRAHLNLVPVEENLTYEQARTREEWYMIEYCTLDVTRKNKTKNQIHGLNPNRPDYDILMDKFTTGQNYYDVSKYLERCNE